MISNADNYRRCKLINMRNVILDSILYKYFCKDKLKRIDKLLDKVELKMYYLNWINCRV